MTDREYDLISAAITGTFAAIGQLEEAAEMAMRQALLRPSYAADAWTYCNTAIALMSIYNAMAATYDMRPISPDDECLWAIEIKSVLARRFAVHELKGSDRE